MKLQHLSEMFDRSVEALQAVHSEIKDLEAYYDGAGEPEAAGVADKCAEVVARAIRKHQRN